MSTLLNRFIEEQHIADVIIESIEKDLKMCMLSPLQREVFEEEVFWKFGPDQKHLLIQGATSSGKTLIAEMLMAKYLCDESCWNESGVISSPPKVLYLAPLRAMVSEKIKTIRKHMEKYKDRIYASSSDYQNDDELILTGNYDIAVMVYEKFFALAAQLTASNPMLSGCGLIVVDEIQMLGSTDRGPKLEFSLTKIRKHFPGIRIIGLTTIYSNINAVRDWLSAELLDNYERSLPLDEYVFYADSQKGYMKGQYTPASLDFYDSNPEKAEEEREEKIREKRKDLYSDGTEKLEIDMEMLYQSSKKNKRLSNKYNGLLNILKRECFKNGKYLKRKIIIFTHSRRNTELLCRIIVESRLFPQHDLPADLLISMSKLDDDEIVKNLILFFRHGISFHYSSLSNSCRSLVEAQFSDGNGCLNILVATETLAIGVNLPADMVIVFDTERPANNEGKMPIEVQSYKNYIGRTGRYMQPSEGKPAPVSYLIAQDEPEFNRYRSSYMVARPTLVKSAFNNLTPLEKAPYYLNVMSGSVKAEDMDNISRLRFHGLQPGDSGERGESPLPPPDKIEEIMSQIAGYNLARKRRRNGPRQSGAEIYSRTDLGDKLAPYALSLETCSVIEYYFVGLDSFEKEENPEASYTHLPKDYCARDLADGKYLLDILYIICQTPEMKKVGVNLVSPPGTPYYLLTKQAVRKYLQKYKADEGADPSADGESADPVRTKTDNLLWKNSTILENLCVTGTDAWTYEDVTAIVKAILLKHWTMGQLQSEIRSNADLKVQFTIGDLDHLGDVAGFITEAISRCMILFDTEGKAVLEQPFYLLSNRIKYGATMDMVKILNCHVFGVSRRSVIELWRDPAANGYKNLADCINHCDPVILQKHGISIQQREEIMEIYRRHYADSYVPLSIRVKNLLGEDSISNTEAEAYWEYADEKSNWKDALVTLFTFSRRMIFAKLNDTSLPADRIYLASSGKCRLFVIFMNDGQSDNNILISSYGNFFKEHGGEKICIISENSFSESFSKIQIAYPKCNFIWMSAYTAFSLYYMSISFQSKSDCDILIQLLMQEKGELLESTVSRVISSTKELSAPEASNLIFDAFISYARYNETLGACGSQNAEALAGKLAAEGISCFYDRISIDAGDDFIEKLNTGLSHAKVFILIVDRRYGKTDWTKTELNVALNKTITNKSRMIPLVMDNDGKAFWKSQGLTSILDYIDCTGELDDAAFDRIKNIVKNARSAQ